MVHRLQEWRPVTADSLVPVLSEAEMQERVSRLSNYER